MSRRTRNAGFTLVEVLVALAMLSLLSAGIIATFRFGQRSYTQVVEYRRGDSDVVLTQRFLRQALESVYPFAPTAGQSSYGFEGRSDAVEFSAPAPQAIAAAGYYRYGVVIRDRDDGRFDLVVRSAVDRNGNTSVSSASTREEVLLEGVAAARWSYLEMIEEAGARPSQSWTSNWSQRDPPDLLRFEVEFPSGDVRWWPELLIAPRVTDDAQCEFDVVAQACRERGL